MAHVPLFSPHPQYMMLSGQVPFQGASGQGGQSQAAEIMCKIREGHFSLDGEAWQGVSEEAKELVRGVRVRVAWGGAGVRCPVGGTPSGWRAMGRWVVVGGGQNPFWGHMQTLPNPSALPLQAS